MPGIFICGRCFAPGDGRFSLGTTSRHGICSRCGGLAAWVIDERVNDPHLASFGLSPEFITACEIEPFPSIVWDVNGYYRALGVSAHATKLEIRKAYQRLEGWDDERLTYIVKQLLNDEVRQAYDAVEFGSVFFDRFVQASVRREMEDEARASMLAGDSDFEDLAPIDLDESLNKSFDVVDKHPWRNQDFGWGYYLWQSACVDQVKASEWRGVLVSAFWERGERQRIAIGFHGGRDTPWEVLTVEDRVVVFLNERLDPQLTFAAEAADHIINGDTPFLPKETRHGIPQGSRSR